MPKFRIKNEKGLYADMHWQNLWGPQQVDHAKTQLDDLARKITFNRRNVEKALDAMSRLPLIHLPEGTYVGRKDRSLHSWARPENFAAKSVAMLDASNGEADTLGWSFIKDIATEEVALNKIADALGDSSMKLWNFQIRGGKTVLAKLRKGEIVIEPQDAIARLAGADAFAIYIPPHTEKDLGDFLGHDGSPAALSGARLFESAEAARRTIGSRRLSTAVVVGVSAQVVSLNPIVAPSTDLGPLMGALAQEERRQLAQVLAQARQEDLESRLAQLKSAEAAANLNASSQSGEKATEIGLFTPVVPKRGRRI